MLCTYHNFDEIKNAYNECVSDNNTSNNSNLFNEPINQQANKDIEDLIYEDITLDNFKTVYTLAKFILKLKEKEKNE